MKNVARILCSRGIVSSARSMFIYRVCTLFCLTSPPGLAAPSALLTVLGAISPRCKIGNLWFDLGISDLRHEDGYVLPVVLRPRGSFVECDGGSSRTGKVSERAML